jgi:hypothetical protein
MATHGPSHGAVRNTMAFLHGRPATILAVSHFYHLPRIKMTFQRSGAGVFTVPACAEFEPLTRNLAES